MAEPHYDPEGDRAAAVPAAAIGAGPAPVWTRERLAEQLRDTAPAMLLYASLASVFPQADALTFRMFRDGLVADAGNPTDPVEVALIESFVMAHLNSARLVARSASAQDLEVARGYGGLAVAMMGEVRRMALALSAYRAASDARKSSGVVSAPVSGADDGELGSKELADGVRAAGEEPPPGRGGEGQSREAKRPVGRRPRAAAGRRAG